jgi:3-deoxy-manno-octulosonate cytidylyltransferase (CMP-KDO synthetase)
MAVVKYVMRALAVIPARLKSIRLARKALLRETGKYLIEHVYERVQKISGLDRVVIATDSEEILTACRDFGAEVLMTRADHISGTDRVAEAAAVLAAGGQHFDVVINVQGDEPELEPKHVEQLLELMKLGDPMGTLAEELHDLEEGALSQVVKVVLDAESRALYFSRSLIPHQRNRGGPVLLRHIGIYGFQAEFLQRFPKLAKSDLEQAEGLEQLRALFHGYRIRVGVVAGRSGRGIDTREDYDGFLLRSQRTRSEAE